MNTWKENLSGQRSYHQLKTNICTEFKTNPCGTVGVEIFHCECKTNAIALSESERPLSNSIAVKKLDEKLNPKLQNRHKWKVKDVVRETSNSCIKFLQPSERLCHPRSHASKSCSQPTQSKSRHIWRPAYMKTPLYIIHQWVMFPSGMGEAALSLPSRVA